MEAIQLAAEPVIIPPRRVQITMSEVEARDYLNRVGQANGPMTYGSVYEIWVTLHSLFPDYGKSEGRVRAEYAKERLTTEP